MNAGMRELKDCLTLTGSDLVGTHEERLYYHEVRHWVQKWGVADLNLLDEEEIFSFDDFCEVNYNVFMKVNFAFSFFPSPHPALSLIQRHSY